MSEENGLYVNIRDLPFVYKQSGEQYNSFIIFVASDKGYFLFYLFSKEDFDFCYEFISSDYKNSEKLNEALRSYFNSKITLGIPENSNFEIQMLEDAAALITWGFITKNEDSESNCENCPLFADITGSQPN